MVEAVGRRLGILLDTPFQFDPTEWKGGAPDLLSAPCDVLLNGATGIANKLPRFYQNPCTIREALTLFCDLTSPPRRIMLTVLSFRSLCVLLTPASQALAEYASDPTERAELKLLGSLATEEKHKLVDRVYWRTFAEILDQYPSVKMRWEDLFSLLPALKSRYYSISSSPLVTPNAIHLTVGRVQRLSPDGKRTLWGVASSFLCDSVAGNTVRAVI